MERELADYLAGNIGALAGEVAFEYSTTADQQGELCRVNVPVHLARGWLLTMGPGSHWGPDDPIIAPQASADQLRSYVEVEWGIGSGLVKAQIDWRQGQVVSFYGTNVTVKVVLPSQGALATAVQGYPVRFRASLAPGDYRPLLPPTRTVYYGAIGIAGITRLPVPPFARRVHFSRSSVNTRPFNVRWARGDGTGLLQLQQYTNANSRLFGEIMFPLIVPPEATFCNIEAVASAEADVIAMYELAL